MCVSPFWKVQVNNVVFSIYYGLVTSYMLSLNVRLIIPIIIQAKFGIEHMHTEQKLWGSQKRQQAGTPESQLAAGQSLTGRHWNSPKKILHIQKQRRSHNEMVGGVQSQ